MSARFAGQRYFRESKHFGPEVQRESSIFHAVATITNLCR
jgi:hypothetical protein